MITQSKGKFCALACVVFLFFISCKKNALTTEGSITGTTLSSDVSVNDVVETASPVWTSVVKYVNSDVAGFWQGVPARYSLTTKKYPLIVFIHGIGELGTDMQLNCCGLPKHLYNKTFPASFTVNGTTHSFIVIAPQFKVRPTAAQVQSVLDFAKARWRIDDTRVYVAGLSMGGGSTWDWSAVYGQKAAAIVPVCGGTYPTKALTAKIASKNLPIWGLYSTADAVVPVAWGRNFFTWIDAANTAYATKTKLTVWTDTDHNGTWARAFNPTTKIDGRNIYEWMLLYTRSTAALPVTTSNVLPVAHAGTDKTIYISAGINRVTLDGTSSTDAGGTITKYSWTKVSGPAADLFNFGTGKTYAAHLVHGTYYFRLTVTNNKGATGTDEIKVTVN
jgi:dienelactone hydrolase